MKNRAVLIAVIEIMLLIIVITMAVIKHDNIVVFFSSCCFVGRDSITCFTINDPCI